MATYLQLTPVPGKWYVSERIPAKSKAWRLADAAPPEPKRSSTEMILAGPFDSHELAMKWRTLTGAAGYIWEREQIGPKPPAP